MPDPVDPTPVKVVEKGGKFAVVTKQGRTIDSAPTRERADGLAAQVNRTWREAKGTRRAKGAPEITRESALGEVLGEIEEFALLGRFEERLHPRQHGKFAAKPHLDAANAGGRLNRPAHQFTARESDLMQGRAPVPGGYRALTPSEKRQQAALIDQYRHLPEAELAEAFGAKFTEVLHPRSRGKFTFSPLSFAERQERHDALERHIASMRHGDKTVLKKAKGHDRLTPQVRIKKTAGGKYLVEGGGQTFKGVNAQELRPHDSPRKAARDALRAWEDAPRHGEGEVRMGARVARNKKIRNSRLGEALGELEETLLPHGRPLGSFGGLARIRFDPAKHPRGRGGEFSDVLGRLAHGGRANLPSGVTVHRHGRDAFEVEVPGEKDRVAGTLPRTATAAHHGGNPELLTRGAASTRALIAHHEVTLGERGTLAHKLASNRLVESERRRVAAELRGLYKVRQGVKGFAARLGTFGHELASDKEVPAWARWGMRLAMAVAVVPIVPGDELIGPLIVGALMVRPSTRKHVKELWDEAKYGLPPGVDIPASEKVERALKRSWARVEGLKETSLEAALADLEELAIPQATQRGASRRTTPAGRSGGRGTSGAAVAAQSAQTAKAAAVRANAGAKAKAKPSGGQTATATTSTTSDEEEKPRQKQTKETD